MTEPETLTEWAEYYRAVFGLCSEDEIAMLVAWVDLFAHQKTPVADLVLATRHVATSNPPQFRNQHLRLLQQSLAEIQFVRSPRVAEEESWPPCPLCGDTGMVVVPHPRDSRYTCAVKCGCRRGSFLRNDMMTLQDYERRNPGWRSLVAEKEALEQSRRRALAITQAADTRLGAIAARIGLMPGKGE